MAGKVTSFCERHERILAAALIAFGAALRLWDLPSMEFKHDEQAALSLGIDLLQMPPWHGGELPVAGLVSSAGISNPPLFNWLMAAFWSVTGDPVGATALVAMVNSVCLLPLYVWAKRLIGIERALIMLGAISLSPFAVIFSRKLWIQNLLLPGICLVLWGLAELRRGETFWRGVALIAWGALLVSQLHQSGLIALAVLPVALACQFWRDRRESPPFRYPSPALLQVISIGAAVAALAFFWLPYLSYLTTISAHDIARRPMLALPWPQLMLNVIAQVLPTDLFWFFRGDVMGFFTEWRDGPVSWSLRVPGFVAACLTGLGLAAWGIWGWFRSPFAIPVIGVWWLGILLMFALARIPGYPHYVHILAPLPALIVAGGFGPTPRGATMSRWLSVTRWCHVVAFGMLTFGTLTWISERGAAAGDYGVSYRVRVDQAVAISAASQGRVVEGLPYQAPSGTARHLNCLPAPPEVTWLIEHKIKLPGSASGFLICDGWFEGNGFRRYAWALALP